MSINQIEGLEGELDKAQKRITQLEFTNQSFLQSLSRLESAGEFQERVELSTDLDQLAEIFLDEAGELIKLEVSALFLVEPHSQAFKLKLSRPSDSATLCQEEVKRQIESGVFSWVLNQRRLAVIPSLALDEGKGELIMVPLTTAKRTIGMLLALVGVAVDLIPQGSLKLLSIMVKQAAFAIENNQLYQGLKDYSLNLEKMVDERRQKLKETQSQLLRSSKLAAVGQLAAGVAHELNNPLGGILGYTQWLLEKFEDVNLAGENTAQIREWLKFIEKETKRCKAIVGGLLGFSRSAEMDFKPLDINQILQETLLFSELSLKQKRIKLVKGFDLSLPQINGNAEQLQQVFTNLILNAQKAMPQRGKLLVSSAFDPKKREIRISFQDTGGGIPNEILSRIFDPFFTTSKPGEGTGLGLSVSYGIVKGHGGHIEVKSKVGKGSTFTVFLSEGRDDVRG